MSNYKSNYSGPTIDEIISKGLALDLTNNGWLKIKSTVDNPVNLDDLTEPGNFTVSNFINGDPLFTDYSPINISNVAIDNNMIQYVIVLNYMFSRTYYGSGWGEWTSLKNSSYIFIQPEEPDTSTLNSLWIDTSISWKYKFTILTSEGWKEFVPVDMMLKSVYDPSGKNVDFYQYADELINDATIIYDNDISKAQVLSYTIPVSANWKTMCYGNGRYVAFSYEDYKIITSIDGINWVESDAYTSIKWSSIAFGNGKFVAIASDSSNVAVSSDGISWLVEGGTISSSDWRCIAFGNGKFVAISAHSSYPDTPAVAISSDGVNWTNIVGLVMREGDIWSDITNPILVSDWSSMVFGNGKFVAVSKNSSNVAFSSDGVSWTNITPLMVSDWSSIAFGNGKFVAVSKNSSNVAVSSDGVSWVLKTAPETNLWNSITFRNDLFIAVAYNSNHIMSSYDGETWVLHDIPSIDNWNVVVASKNSFLLISDSDKVVIYWLSGSSISDRLNEHASNPEIHVNQQEKDIWNSKISSETVSDELILLKGNIETIIDEKVDLLSENVNDLSDQIDTNNQNINLHINNTLVHISEAQKTDWDSKASGTHAHILDGRVEIDASKIISGELNIARIPAGAKERIKEVASDTERFALTTDSLTGVQNGDLVYVNDTSSKKFYVVVDDTKLNIEEGYIIYNAGVAASIQWANVKSKPTTLSGYGITDAYSKLEIAVLIQNALDNGILYTDTTIEEFLNSFESILVLTTNGTSNYNWGSVCYGNGMFIAISNNTNNIMISPDGITWTLRTLPISGGWTSITYGDGMFVVVGNESHLVMSSPDGITWTPRSGQVTTIWQSVCHGNQMFVAISDNIHSMYSINGIQWSAGGTLNNGIQWNSVCYGNGVFVAVGNASTVIMYSNNLNNAWLSSDPIPLSTLYSVTYGNGLFVAVGKWFTNNRIFTSPDGITWTLRTVPITGNWNNVSFGDGIFVITAKDTTNALYSKDGINWTELELPFPSTWFSITHGNGKFVIVSSNSSSVLNIVYTSGSISGIINLQQNAIDAMTNIIRDSLYISGVLIKDVIISNSQQINTNAYNINIINTSINDINDGLTEAETISAQILALIQ